MLIIDGNSVYEVDEECLRTHKRPKDCVLPDEIMNNSNNFENCIRINLNKNINK